MNKILFNTETQSFQPYPRDDDAEVIGLDPIYSVYTFNQDAPPSYDPALKHLQQTESVDHTSRTVQRGWTLADNVISVSMTSMRQALTDAGLRQAVIDAIAAIPDETQRLYAQDWWATSPVVQKGHPLVVSLAEALNQTPEAVDALFAAAKLKDA